jgi:3-(3-hydroxy-phenyl)propionate hydroxylase
MEAEVAIVGFGPVGVTAANFLGSYGIKTVVFERDAAIYPRARAVTVNDWTMRAFQSLGLDRALRADMEVNGALNWKTYGGKTVFRMMPLPSGIGHPGSLMIYQPAMEATLRRGVERFAGTVDVHFGQSVTNLTQDPDGVTLNVKDLNGGAERRVRARYVLACDGGSSRIRTELGVKLLGVTHETQWIVIDAEVLRWWPDCKELIFWSDPERPVVDIPLACGYHRWELPLRAGETEADFETEQQRWALLEPLGVKRENVRITQHAFYVHHVRKAEKWRVGRVLLLGDAAHLMPPWAGQGMQSGIRDAQNATWKLREVLAGRLGDEVLDAYQAERAPHVAAMTEMAQKMGWLIAARDPKFVFLRNTLGPLLMRLPFITRKMMPSTAPALTAGWLKGLPGKHSLIGRMLPQPEVCNARGLHVPLDDLLGDGFAVLGIGGDPRRLMSAAAVQAWQGLGARFIAVQGARASASADSDLIDHTGTLTAWMRRYGSRVIAVRPDRFVAASDSSGLEPPTPVRLAATGARVLQVQGDRDVSSRS